MEQWRAIQGYEGYYEVSDCGHIRSLGRELSDGRRLRGKVLKSVPSTGGYLQVMLCVHSVKRQTPVHRAVLTAFVRPAGPGEQARHLNGDQTNNTVDNLAWGSASDNMWDKVRLRTHHYQQRDSCKWGHLLVAPNLNPVSSGRQCRACVLSRTAIRDAKKCKGIALDHQVESDRRYAEVMAQA